MTQPKGRYEVTSGLEVLKPKSGPAYPIPCSEWDHLITRLQQVSHVPWAFQLFGSILLGAAVSTFIAIVTGSVAEAGNRVVIAWSVVAVTFFIGVAFLVLGKMQFGIQKASVANVIDQMRSIEQRYERREETKS